MAFYRNCRISCGCGDYPCASCQSAAMGYTAVWFCSRPVRCITFYPYRTLSIRSCRVLFRGIPYFIFISFFGFYGKRHPPFLYRWSNRGSVFRLTHELGDHPALQSCRDGCDCRPVGARSNFQDYRLRCFSNDRHLYASKEYGTFLSTPLCIISLD